MATIGLGYWGENKTVTDFGGYVVGHFVITGSRRTPRSYISNVQYTLDVTMKDGKRYVGYSAGKSMAITGKLRAEPKQRKPRAKRVTETQRAANLEGKGYAGLREKYSWCVVDNVGNIRARFVSEKDASETAQIMADRTGLIHTVERKNYLTRE